MFFFEVVLLRVYFWYTKIKGVVHVLFYLFANILDLWDFGILQSLDFGVFFSQVVLSMIFPPPDSVGLLIF